MSDRYEKGDVKIYDPENPGDYIASSLSISAPVAFLPHSCDEWVIGGRAEVEAMIADLQAALAQL